MLSFLPFVGTLLTVRKIRLCKLESTKVAGPRCFWECVLKILNISQEKLI